MKRKKQRRRPGSFDQDGEVGDIAADADAERQGHDNRKGPPVTYSRENAAANVVNWRVAASADQAEPRIL